MFAKMNLLKISNTDRRTKHEYNLITSFFFTQIQKNSKQDFRLGIWLVETFHFNTQSACYSSSVSNWNEENDATK